MCNVFSLTLFLIYLEIKDKIYVAVLIEIGVSVQKVVWGKMTFKYLTISHRFHIRPKYELLYLQYGYRFLIEYKHR